MHPGRVEPEALRLSRPRRRRGRDDLCVDRETSEEAAGQPPRNLASQLKGWLATMSAKSPLTDEPKAVTAAIITSAMRETISPYSIAVAPRSLRASEPKRERRRDLSKPMITSVSQHGFDAGDDDAGDDVEHAQSCADRPTATITRRVDIFCPPLWRWTRRPGETSA